MASSLSVPDTQPPCNTETILSPTFSWDCTSKQTLIAWLLASADRLDKGADRSKFDRRERDRLLRMATAARETASWYANQNGGER